MFTVAAFTGGKNASPARFRVRQYIPVLKSYEIELTEFAAPLSSWPPGRKWLRPAWAVATLASRIPAIISSHRYDVTLLQQSMVSTYYTLEGITGGPRVLDIDDALWAFSARKKFVNHLAGMCDSVICGNSFLADYLSQWNANVVVIPPGVDTKKFCPGPRRSSEKCVIGWSGGSGGFQYLYTIESALKKVLESNPQIIFSVIADRKPDLRTLPARQVSFTPWSPENEVRTIQMMDIGIMPIDDCDAARGKCSYKMLLYMACGKPVVVSPVGMNLEVAERAGFDTFAQTENQWVERLLSLVDSPEIRLDMGERGREAVTTYYSTKTSAAQLAFHLLSYK